MRAMRMPSETHVLTQPPRFRKYLNVTRVTLRIVD